MNLEVKILEGNTSLKRTFRKIPASLFLSMWSLDYTDFLDVLESKKSGFKDWLMKIMHNYKIEFLVTPLYKGDTLADTFVLENEIIIWVGDNRVKTQLFFMNNKDYYKLSDIINPRIFSCAYEEFVKAERVGKGLCLMDCFNEIVEAFERHEHGKATEEYVLGLMEDMKIKGGK